MIYIIANSNAISGGPELLHQCCGALRNQGYNAKMLYFDKIKFPAKPSANVKDLYGVYGVEYSLEIHDTQENSIIIPETALFFLPRFKNIKKIIWWLSVDGYFSSMKSKTARWYAPFGMKFSKYNPFGENIIHFCQSEYAFQFLKKNNIQDNIYELSDYLSMEFMKQTQNEAFSVKEDIVLYNPRKGYEFTRKIMNKITCVEWVPLTGYTHKEMVNIMMKSKVYIDFGHHPGKDRIPREAAMCGCCIITGRDGAAQNNIDIPIQNHYKFDANDENIDKIVSRIQNCLENYENLRKDFDSYRKIILGEENKFNEDIRRLGFLFKESKVNR